MLEALSDLFPVGTSINLSPTSPSKKNIMLQQISDMASQAGPYSTYGQVMAGALFLGFVLYICFHEQGLHPGIPAFGIDDKGWMRLEKSRKKYTERGVQLVGEAIRQVRRAAPVSPSSSALTDRLVCTVYAAVSDRDGRGRQDLPASAVCRGDQEQQELELQEGHHGGGFLRWSFEDLEDLLITIIFVRSSTARTGVLSHSGCCRTNTTSSRR